MATSYSDAGAGVDARAVEAEGQEVAAVTTGAAVEASMKAVVAKEIAPPPPPPKQQQQQQQPLAPPSATHEASLALLCGRLEGLEASMRLQREDASAMSNAFTALTSRADAAHSLEALERLRDICARLEALCLSV